MSLGEEDNTTWASKTLQKLFLRVRITISCRMNFDDYPLDAHTCQFQVGSCKSSTQKKGNTRSCFHYRLRHKRHGDLHGQVHLRLEAAAQFTAFPHNRRLAGAVSHRRHSLRWSMSPPWPSVFRKKHIPWNMYPDQCLMRYLQPVEKNISTEPNGNCSAKVNL